MTLRQVANMTAAERDERREADEAAFHSVEALCASGVVRSKALTRAASSLGIARRDVIAGYWRHVRRVGR